MATVYKDYFQIDENYFPCVNESAINAGLKWDEFYPHSTFIDLLRKTERSAYRALKNGRFGFPGPMVPVSPMPLSP
ncbi:MAG: hypothetical protein ACOX0U_01520 [Oscillospiraceae bacterium]